MAEVGMTVSRQEDEQWRAITSLERGFERTAAILETVAQRLGNIETKVAEAARPQWQALGVLLAGFIALGSVVGYGINSKINNVADNLSELNGRFIAHTADGHPASMVARIEANHEAISAQLANDRRELDQLITRINRLEDRRSRGIGEP
jgi:uncharacterized coiled-coil protein SlyX